MEENVFNNIKTAIISCVYNEDCNKCPYKNFFNINDNKNCLKHLLIDINNNFLKNKKNNKD